MAIASTRLPEHLALAEPERRWRRWPCPRCGHRGRFAVVCPSCEALPWTAVPGPEAPPAASREGFQAPDIAARMLRPGTDLDVRGGGLFKTRHRFSTPEGFLGLLARRFSGGATWLGIDGREWRIQRPAVFGRSWILRDATSPIAAAESRGFWHSGYQIWQQDRNYRLLGEGLSHRSFLLAIEDGPEVLHIHGGVLNPLRRIEVLAEVPIATAVLAGFLVCGLRQGEGE